MDQKRRATREERRRMKDAVLAALATDPDWPAVDAGEVLVSIGAAMIKASAVTREQFLENAGRAWDAQTPPKVAPGGPN